MSLNFYRSDGWVKTTQGPAVPGAQIYVCTQPANVSPPATPPRTTPVPWQGPNPQAKIYSDNGLTPIVQPIITDGFGHYDFYALPGLYTLVVMFGGKVQQVYVDQSLGNVGTNNASSIQLLTNGTPNFNQFVQNIVQGSGMTIATDNFGNTVFTVTGSLISPGENVVEIPWVYRTVITSSNQTEVSSTGVVLFPSSSISVPAKNWTITIDVISASIAFDDIAVARTLPGSLNVLDWTPITFGGSDTPLLFSGLNTSDSISLQIDSEHDYYFMCHEPTGNSSANRLFSTGYSNAYPGGTMGNGTANQIGVSPIQNPLFTGSLNSGMWIVSWKSS